MPLLPRPCDTRPPTIQSYLRPSMLPSTGTPPKTSKCVLLRARSIRWPPSMCIARTAPVESMKRPKRVSLTPLGSRTLIVMTSASKVASLSLEPN